MYGFISQLVNYPQSAYLHIPFCHRRCFYCDFPVVPLGDSAQGDHGPGSNSIKSYLDLLYRDISLSPKGIPLATVYIGGGTPSLLSSYQVASLLDHLRVHFGFQYGAEITLEIDPASFDKVSLEGFLEAGINRLSLGAQSFDNNVLKILGRRHSSRDLLEACNLIQDCFKSGQLASWSLDLIKNLPGQNLISWKRQLSKAISILPPHLSIYDLSIEKGTVFAWKMSRGELSLPNDEMSFEISRVTSQILKEEGFSRYEISNYALPGHASRHNRVYWSGASWWGFGQGATACPWGNRFSRPRTRKLYKQWLEMQEISSKNESLKSIQKSQHIPFEDLLIVGLRRREGVNLKELSKDLGWSKDQLKANINALKNCWEYPLGMGWIKQRGWRFYLTDPEGMEISNQILVQMLEWWESLNGCSSD